MFRTACHFWKSRRCIAHDRGQAWGRIRSILRPIGLLALLVVVVAPVIFTDPIWAQEDSNRKRKRELRPGRLPSEVRRALVGGLMAIYSRHPESQATAGVKDRRIVRLPTLFFSAADRAQGKSPSPFFSLAPDESFEARFEGYLKLKLKGTYTFSLAGMGIASLRINGRDVLNDEGDFEQHRKTASVDLVKGYNQFDLKYVSPPSGKSQLRVYWENESFVREPVPAINFFVPENLEGLEQGERAHQGRMLALQKNCLKCHVPSAPVDPLVAAKDTPDLSVSVSRLNAAWISSWLKSPDKLRNQVSMPDLLLEEKTASDISAYLVEQFDQQPVLPKKSIERLGDAERGGDAYENLGCIGCHRFTPPAADDEYDRLSLHFVDSKFRKGMIAEFLSDPRAHYQSSRMPQFRLTPDQTVDLEAFLRESADGQLPQDRVKGDPVVGKTEFVARGCANCHQVSDLDGISVEELAAPDWEQLSGSKGCLEEPGKTADAENSRAPRYTMDAASRASLVEFVAANKVAESEPFEFLQPAHYAQFQTQAMRCVTCHDLDDEQATLPYIIEEEGAVGLPPNRVPALTYAGEKLLTQWSEQIITGKLSYKVREHFRVQMPGFPVRGKRISRGLAEMHGFAGNENDPIESDEKLIKQGAAVAAMNTGLSCNRCHAIGDRKPNAAFDAQSTNLIYAAKRLRHEYYLRWMFDPLRIDKQTKMPKFSEDGKSTSLAAVLEGDAKRQFEALWQYLRSIQAR